MPLSRCPHLLTPPREPHPTRSPLPAYRPTSTRCSHNRGQILASSCTGDFTSAPEDTAPPSATATLAATPSPTAIVDYDDRGAATLSPIPATAATPPPLAGDENGDGLVNSADTGIAGDTNGDGIVNIADTGIVGDNNGESVPPLGC